jgi:hypothetical protein
MPHKRKSKRKLSKLTTQSQVNAVIQRFMAKAINAEVKRDRAKFESPRVLESTRYRSKMAQKSRSVDASVRPQVNAS